MSSEPSERKALDVRDLDGEPFGEIMAALNSLQEGETLELINGFEPEPLYDVLERRGFTYNARQVADDEWRVEISHA